MLIKPNHIYQEDCITFMQKMREGNMLVDVIVTSPPYNIGKDYGPGINDSRPRDEYLCWMEEVAEKSSKVLKENGSFFLNIYGRSSDRILPLEVAIRFAKHYKLQNDISWIKSIAVEKEDIGKNNGFPEGSIGHFNSDRGDKYLSNMHEYIFHFTKNGDVELDKKAIGVKHQDKSNIERWGKTEDKRDRGDVWFIPYKTIQESRPHPTEFPVKLPELCIKLCRIKPNMFVYDPFMGSGNTAIVCKCLGVNYIGTELNGDYIETANEKISRITPTLEKQSTMLTSTQSGTLLSYFSAPI